MKLARTISALPLILLLAFVVTAQETEREQRRTTAPTVTGATGLFTVYDASTLRKTEYNFGFFANNFDRDPGDVDIMTLPVNFAIGVTDNIELFVNVDADQKLTSGALFELSGSLFPKLSQQQRSTFDFGPIGGTERDGPGFFPLAGSNVSGALVGGILPGLPQSGGFRVVDGTTTKFVGRLPGYLNNYPFFGRGGHTLGNVTAGGKIRFTSHDARVGVAAVILARIPTIFAGKLVDDAFGGRLVRGAGAGTNDFGGFLVISPRFGIVSTHLNVGYMHNGDPETRGFELLDRSDELILSAGIDVPFTNYFQVIGETTWTRYVAAHTPSLDRIDPFEFVVGARFYPFGKRTNSKFMMSFGGGYRYLLNNSGAEREALRNRLRPGQNRPTADYHGFVANLTLGYRKVAAAPAKDPCAANRGPSISLSANKLAVKERSGESVSLTASVTDPDNDQLTYSWEASGGSISGTGNSVSWNSTGLAPGDYRITVTATDVCNNKATDSRVVTVEKANRCPTVSLKASTTSIQEGSDQSFVFTATGDDPDGDKLQYSWTTSKGSLTGTDTSKKLDTTGLSAGQITVKVSVTDGQCPATESITVTITPKPKLPSVFTTACSTYRTANDTRPDNACKRVLDDVASRLQSDPSATLILDGHSDKGEKKGTARRRAERVRDYLVNERKVDINRVEIRSYDDTRPHESGDRKMNRRVTIHIVPQGATRPQ
ncbi:MAG: PKD domain-containing protein [Acidobacteriota bacterium]|nr:PKD domain-containing protein [Blastocatellia bacterium]MDW8412541.1 PKD domain-containing protein [Acidobacteriota bacterium]